MIRTDQIQKIHIKRKQANLTREDYEALLAAYDAASCKDLSIPQADALISQLDAMIQPQIGHGFGKTKYDHLGQRAGYAAPRELRKIEAIWRDVARDPSDQALESFIIRQTGVQKLIWLKREHVKPVLTALKYMKKDKEKSHAK